MTSMPNILRHSCAFRLGQAGIGFRRGQTFLGHQTIQMTQRCVSLATSDLNQCAIALNSCRQANRRQIETRRKAPTLQKTRQEIDVRSGGETAQTPQEKQA